MTQVYSETFLKHMPIDKDTKRQFQYVRLQTSHEYFKTLWKDY